MICKKCGAQSDDDARFCGSCGSPIEQAEPQFQPQIQPKPTAENKQFSVNKAAQPQQPASRYQSAPSPAPKKSNTGMIIAIIILSAVIVIGAAVGGVIWYRNYMNEQEELESSEREKKKEKKEKEEKSKETPMPSLSPSPSVDITGDINYIISNYNAITSSISNGTYKRADIGNGVSAYYDNMNQMHAIIAPKGVGNTNYTRYYYFDGENLMFAYYEGSDAHRFYYKNNSLIRWRYSANAYDSQNSVNHDMQSDTQYLTWETSVLSDALLLKIDWETAAMNLNNTTTNEYILPGSDARYISAYELDGLTKDQLKLARNELYARHGRKFNDAMLSNYFSQFSWYHPTIEPDAFSESMLNQYEIANRDFIVEYEKGHGYR